MVAWQSLRDVGWAESHDYAATYVPLQEAHVPGVELGPPTRTPVRFLKNPSARALIACYRDGMVRKTTTVRMPDDLAETAEVVARGRGVSLNTLVIEALRSEIDRVRQDKDFMARLRDLTERDKEILDRLAE